MRPPKYYDKLYELTDEDGLALDLVKLKRKNDAILHVDNNTPERLAVREQVKKAQITKLVKTL